MNRIREHREAKGFSRDRLAAAARVSTSYLYQLERQQCNPTVDVAYRITDALNASFEDVFPRNELAQSA